MTFVSAAKAEEWIETLDDCSVDLWCIDPPFYRVVNADWDRKWASYTAYSYWIGSMEVV